MSFSQGKHLEEGEYELFNTSLLERISLPQVEGLLIRSLRSGDYDREFLQLLSQLTDVGNITRQQFLNRFHSMKSAGDYHVVVVEDLNAKKIIACATLVTEQKFIHNCALRGSLQDVVVNNNYRGKHLGKLIVNVIVQLARSLHCYKLSLECQDRLIPFYETLGFKRENNNANCLNMRFHSETAAEQSRL
ncbi:hypothetical protein KM043_009775 [Ampulex compressa]|nr:hypothetical protein KM043_009775 [Ampulex compressa]